MNPTATNLHAKIKLQKRNTPIRLIVNWKNVRTYEIAKYLEEHNNKSASPTCIQHSKFLPPITHQKNIQVSKNVQICSFNIRNIPNIDTVI